MRNIVFLLAVVFSMFFSACSPESKAGFGVYKIVQGTATYFCTEPVLADRFSCSGKILDDPKVTDWASVQKETTTVVPCNFSDEDLRNAGYTYTGEFSESSIPVRVEEEEIPVKKMTVWSFPNKVRIPKVEYGFFIFNKDEIMYSYGKFT